MSFTALHLYFDDVEVGQQWESLGRTITETDVVQFAGVSGDFNPIHMDHEFARSTPFRRPIAHGLLVFSVASGLGLHCPPMRTLALLQIREWYFREPVFFGDTIRVRGEVVHKEVRARGRRGEITWRRQVVNQEGKVVQEGVVVTLVEGRGGRGTAAKARNGPGRPRRFSTRRSRDRERAVRNLTARSRSRLRRTPREPMKEFQLYGLGNALVDIFVEVSDDEFRSLGFERGSSRLVEAAEQKALLERFQDHDLRLVSGGSVANSVIAFSQLGGDAAFLGCVGDDRYGLFYETEFEELGIDDRQHGPRRRNHRDLRLPHHAGRRADHAACRWPAPAGWRRSTWTRSGSRTRNGCSSRATASPTRTPCRRPSARRCASPASTASRWPSPAPRRSSSTSSATPFSRCSSRPTCCSATPTRPRAVTGVPGAKEAFAKLKGVVPSAVVTDGPHGAYVRHGGVEAHVPAFPCKPVDLTGAGDMLAGAFLYGITHGVAAGQGGAGGLLPGHEGHHAGRRPAAPRHAAVLGRVFGVNVTASGGVSRLVRHRRTYLRWLTPRSPFSERGRIMARRLRTFIAVDLGKPLRDRLVGLQESLARGGAEVKWVEVENLHVTLLFLGEVDERELPPLCRAVSRGVRPPRPLSARRRDGRLFPEPAAAARRLGRRRRRARPELVALHDALEPPLLELGCLPPRGAAVHAARHAGPRQERRPRRRAGGGAGEEGELARRRGRGAGGAGDEQPADAEGAGVHGPQPGQAAEAVGEARRGGGGRGGIKTSRLAATRRGARGRRTPSRRLTRFPTLGDENEQRVQAEEQDRVQEVAAEVLPKKGRAAT